MTEQRRVDLFALGGTIASIPTADGTTGQGALPTLRAQDLVAAVPQLSDAARVRATQVLQVPSCDLTPDDLVALVATMRSAVASGADGIVVTQGTDTLEESAFLVDLLWDLPEPVVFTGAMRTPSSPGADGPANLLAAVQAAADAQCRDLGVLVCLGDELHAARRVRKTHTSSPAAFTSPGWGPLGRVTEGRPVVALRPARRPRALRINPSEPLPSVALHRVALGDDGRLLEAVGELGYAGLVVEGLGGGHVPSRLVAVLERLALTMPVLLASRTGAGRVLSSTYGYAGGEIDLLSRGLVSAGALDGSKARLLLMLGIASGVAIDEVLRLQLA